MRKPRTHHEILNDLDGRIVSLFKAVRDQGDRIAREIFWTPFARVEHRDAIAKTESRGIKGARRLLVLAEMGFAGQLNAKTGFRGNDAKAAMVWRNRPSNLLAVADRLRGVVIENAPACDVIERFDSTRTLFYVDPPYVLSSRRAGGYRHELSDEEHERLAHLLKRVKGAVCVSGYPSKLYRRLFKGWRVASRTALAEASGTRRGSRVEMLWMNY